MKNLTILIIEKETKEGVTSNEFCFIKSISQWNKNNHSPRLTVDATVVSKRDEVTTHHHNNGTGGMHVTHSTTYYVTFQVESGDFSFQGTRYLGFSRK